MTSEKGRSVHQDISFWLKQEKELKGLLWNDIEKARHFLNEKLRYFNSVQNKQRDNISEGEKILLNVVKGEIKKLEKQLYPNPVARLLLTAKRAIRGIMEERKAMKEHGFTKSPPLTFNQKKIDNSAKISTDGSKENLKNSAVHEIKQKDLQTKKMNIGPLKESAPSRNTIAGGTLRNLNSENNNRGSKLKDETSPRKQLRHRLH